jgi:hypothetical protein
MAKYLVEASYTAEGLKGLIKDKASGRKAAVAKALADLGGKLEAIYFTLGERDVLLLCECPDNASVASLWARGVSERFGPHQDYAALNRGRVGPNDCQGRRLSPAGDLMDWSGQYVQRFESFCPSYIR